jgi:hypothetical protein
VKPSPSSEERATILVDVLTREEFLGEPERIDFPQPQRPKKPSPPAEENE